MRDTPMRYTPIEEFLAPPKDSLGRTILRQSRHTSLYVQLLMASSESLEPRSSLLLQSSRKWGIKHLKALKVTQELNVPAVELVDAAYLPTDKDEGTLLHPNISRVLRATR